MTASAATSASGGGFPLPAHLLRPFLAGAAAAYASVLLVRLSDSRRRRRKKNDDDDDNDDDADAVRSRGDLKFAGVDADADGVESDPYRQPRSNREEATATFATPAPSSDVRTAPPPAPTLMDSPSLDIRMIRKAEGAIRLRTTRLAVVIERCTNDHNYSAILRTVEALGVQRVYIVAPPGESTVEGLDLGSGEDGGDDNNREAEKAGAIKLKRSTGQVIKGASESEARERALHHLFAKRATEWITVSEFNDTKSCLKELRREGYEVWATDLGQEAVPLTREALLAAGGASSGDRGDSGDGDGSSGILPERLAIAFGTEAVGCTAELLGSADLRVYLPLRGFADSLNLSVATALVVHHLFLLDPTLVGAMTDDERTELRTRWYSKLCSQRLMGSKDKKERKLLTTYVTACKELKRKVDAGEHLTECQAKKLDGYKESNAKLEAMERDLEEKSLRAVEGLVKNPPDPISDMRRADEHRVTYVGKKTKGRTEGAWDGMAATANYKTALIEDEASTARFFRSKVQETDTTVAGASASS